MMMAAEGARALSVAQLLVQKGADTELRTNDGWLCSFVQLPVCRGQTAAELARATGHHEVLAVVLEGVTEPETQIYREPEL